jgi:hypothetical protein
MRAVTAPADLDPPLIDNALAAFLAGPVAINVSSHSPAMVPSVARGYGCRVSADRRLVTLFVVRTRAVSVLRDLRGGAPIAVIFSRPRTHVSLQMKADRAELSAPSTADQDLMRRYGIAFVAEIVALGYPRDFSERLMGCCDEPGVAVRFRPAALFEQTPGPNAGDKLEAQP